MKQEFKVRWTEPVSDGGIPVAEYNDAEEMLVTTYRDKQLHRMRMLRHQLTLDGFKLDHTDEEGFLVYVKGEAE